MFFGPKSSTRGTDKSSNSCTSIALSARSTETGAQVDQPAGRNELMSLEPGRTSPRVARNELDEFHLVHAPILTLLFSCPVNYAIDIVERGPSPR